MPPRVSVGPMGWAKRCGTLRARTYALKSSRCARRAQPRTTRSSGHSGESATGARLGAPVPPLSHWILLRPHVDASRHLRYRLRRTHAPWVRVEESVRFFLTLWSVGPNARASHGSERSGTGSSGGGGRPNTCSRAPPGAARPLRATCSRCVFALQRGRRRRCS